MRWTAVLLICAGLLGSCCEGPAAQGNEGQACYPNDTCNVGFDCIGGVCLGPGVNCGNTVCDADETALSCPVDCGNGSCGNGVIDADADEVCDGSALNDQTCAALGHVGGALACGPDCLDFDETSCHSCGDSVIQIPEVCDATNLGGLTCLDVGYLSGTLVCGPDCLSHDTSACTTTCEALDCSTCLGSDCARAACASEIAACDANSDCLSLGQCLQFCSDVNCQTNCANQFPQGVTDYMAARNCLVCDPDVCFDECDGTDECP
jgi:hypothetical protein